MHLSLAITTLLSVASAAAGIETSPGSLRGKKKSSSPSSNSLSKTKHSAADRHTPSFNSTKKSSPLAVASEPWADDHDRPSKSKSKPKPERLAGSIVTVKKQVKKGNSNRHLSSQCIDTPEWVDSFGDGCEWYETNDEPGCPEDGADWDGGMGVANDNCCHCKDEDGTSPTPAPGPGTCTDTPNWVDSYGDGCEWYKANNNPGCPEDGANWDGGMGVANDNCCHCKEGSSTSTTCPKLSDSQCSDQLCTCPSSGKHLRINAKDLNPSGGDCFACVYPDYGWNCVDDYDCDINNSKCAVVRADYEGPNKPLTNTATMCIPKEGAEKGMPCYTNQYCASGMCNLLKDGTFNSQHGECTEDPVEQVNPVNCWEDGAYCAGGTTCNSCCNSWSWKWDVFFTTCGV